jgi:hypothetical protein
VTEQTNWQLHYYEKAGSLAEKADAAEKSVRELIGATEVKDNETAKKIVPDGGV